MIKLAVVGKNISYSKSPFIHSAFGKALGIAVDYSIQDVGEGSFADQIKTLQNSGFLGCNITVPFKEEAFAIADVKSERAMQAEAANTFVFQANQIFADNTDGIGLVRDITQNIGFTLRNKNILICGAGGAVRGILGPLLAEKPCKIVIANRTLQKGQDLAGIFSSPVEACTYEELARQQFNVLIDGTSLKNELLPLPEALSLTQEALVYDLKYSVTGPTQIMQWGLQKGAPRVHDGIGMLVEQAAEAFAIWTGKRPDTTPVIRELKEHRP